MSDLDPNKASREELLVLVEFVLAEARAKGRELLHNRDTEHLLAFLEETGYLGMYSTALLETYITPLKNAGSQAASSAKGAAASGLEQALESLGTSIGSFFSPTEKAVFSTLYSTHIKGPIHA